MKPEWTSLGRPVRYECSDQLGRIRSGWVIAFRAYTEPWDDPDCEVDVRHIMYLASDAEVILVQEGDLMVFYL